MSEVSAFHPPRREGIVFHIISIGVLISGVIVSLIRLTSVDFGAEFFVYLVPIAIAIPLIPLLIYRLSYLQNAFYSLERDSIGLQWGLRVETIPTSTILWVQKASDLAEPIRYPFFRWHGSVLGTTRLSGETPVEFLASSTRELVLIATYERVFAISPENTDEFLQAYQRLTELGSLVSHQPSSESPTSLIEDVWKKPLSRNLIVTGFFLGILLIIWTIIAAPTKSEISLGFTATGEPRDPILGFRLILLPILNTITMVVNFFVGIFLFRNPERRIISYLLWGNSILVSSLFLVAIFIILRI